MRKPRTIAVVDTAACTHCPHAVMALGSGFFCPCEDCHPGGLWQGREPFNITFVSPREGNPFSVVASESTPEPAEEDGLWVDPIHAL